MPPLHGSASTSSASSAVCRQRGREDRRACAAAAGDHRDDRAARSSSRPRRPRRTVSAISSPSCSGSAMTCCAPTAMAAWKSAALGLRRERQARRGHAVAAHGRRSDERPPHRAIRPRRQSTTLRPDGSVACTTCTSDAAATRSTSSRSAWSSTSDRIPLAAVMTLSLRPPTDTAPSRAMTSVDECAIWGQPDKPFGMSY